MRLGGFQLIDNEKNDNSIIKRDFPKIYHQKAANLNDSDHNIDIIFVGNNNYHQVGNDFFKYKMTIEKDFANVANRVFVDADVFSLVNNAFAYCFKETRVSTTGSSDTEHNKYVGQVSTIMRAFRSKDGD